MKEQLDKLVERYREEMKTADRFLHWNQTGQSRISKELRIRNSERMELYRKVINDLTLILT